jgi:hypothetical protein
MARVRNARRIVDFPLARVGIVSVNFSPRCTQRGKYICRFLPRGAARTIMA